MNRKWFTFVRCLDISRNEMVKNSIVRSETETNNCNYSNQNSINVIVLLLTILCYKVRENKKKLLHFCFLFIITFN